MNKQAILKKKYKTEEVCKILSVSHYGKSVLDLESRWILSRMHFQYKGSPASVKKISADCRLHRTKSVPKKLNQMLSLGLVKKIGLKWIAVKTTSLTEDQKILFLWHESSGKPRLAYNWVVRLPGKSLLHGCLFWRTEATAKLASIFQCSKKSVQRNRPKVSKTVAPVTYEVTSAPAIDRVQNTKTIKVTQDKPMKIEKTTIEEVLNISEEAIPEVQKFKRLTAGLSSKEQNQLLGLISDKLGPNGDIGDYLTIKLPEWNRRFFTGVTYSSLLREIA